MNSEVVATSPRSTATRGAYMEVIAFGASYVLRFVSTLVLTRLLFPEIFGLASIVSIFVFGLTMLSDTGIAQGIIQSKRGDDLRYLNTAWSFSILRGVAIWLVACALAWPFALVYGEPQLFSLIIAGSFGALIGGFNSTSLITLRRHLSLGRLAAIEVSTQLIALVVTIVWAYLMPSVWAIIGGGLSAAVFKVIASHMVEVGYRNRFEWHWLDAKAIFDFGKWIMGSSALSFVGSQADRLILGHLAGMASLGVYYIATTLSDAAGALAGRITTGVLYPVLSQVARDNPAQIRRAYYRARLRTDLIGLLPLGVVFTIAQLVTDIVYDQRYQEAGWMLQILCIRVALGITLETMKDCLMALGHVRTALYQSIARALGMLIGAPLGWHFFGIEGIVWAAVGAELTIAPVMLFAFQHKKLLLLHREFYAACIFALGVGLGYIAEIVIVAAIGFLGFTI